MLLPGQILEGQDHRLPRPPAAMLKRRGDRGPRCQVRCSFSGRGRRFSAGVVISFRCRSSSSSYRKIELDEVVGRLIAPPPHPVRVTQTRYGRGWTRIWSGPACRPMRMNAQAKTAEDCANFCRIISTGSSTAPGSVFFCEARRPMPLSHTVSSTVKQGEPLPLRPGRRTTIGIPSAGLQTAPLGARPRGRSSHR